MNNFSVIWEAALSISQHSLSPTVEQALNPSCWLLSMEIKMQCRLLIQSYYFTRCRKVKLLPGAKRPQLSDPEAIILPTQSNSHTCVLHLRFVQLIWSSSLLFWADSCPFTSGIISQFKNTCSLPVNAITYLAKLCCFSFHHSKFETKFDTRFLT